MSGVVGQRTPLVDARAKVTGVANHHQTAGVVQSRTRWPAGQVALRIAGGSVGLAGLFFLWRATT